jgi:hypothetical protein
MLIENAGDMIEPPPSRVVYCYSEYQSMFNAYPNVQFHEGLPDATDFDGRDRVLLILDDLMQEINETVATCLQRCRTITPA